MRLLPEFLRRASIARHGKSPVQNRKMGHLNLPIESDQSAEDLIRTCPDVEGPLIATGESVVYIAPSSTKPYKQPDWIRYEIFTAIPWSFLSPFGERAGRATSRYDGKLGRPPRIHRYLVRNSRDPSIFRKKMRGQYHRRIRPDSEKSGLGREQLRNQKRKTEHR